MKGLIFVEFLEMVESKIGAEATEQLIEESNLPSQGVYTTVGTYEDSEIVSLVVNLHKKTNIPIPDLLKTFGAYLFNRFVVRYKDMMDHMTSSFDLLKKIDNYIHVEVQKLYPEANLPKFDYEELSENKLKLIYKSNRKMPDLAEGLIAACMDHYQENYTITRNLINEDASHVEFIIEKE